MHTASDGLSKPFPYKNKPIEILTNNPAFLKSRWCLHWPS